MPVFSYIYLQFWCYNVTFCLKRKGMKLHTLSLLYVLIIIVVTEILNLFFKKETKYIKTQGHTLQEVQNSANSGNRINYWSMNWRQFKDHVSHMCLTHALVASGSLMQEVAGSSPFTVMTNIFLSLKTMKTLRENWNGTTKKD